jgi:hypothetical protein
LDGVGDYSGIVDADRDFGAPDFFALFVEDHDCFALKGCEPADCAWRLDQDGDTCGGAVVGGVHASGRRLETFEEWSRENGLAG